MATMLLKKRHTLSHIVRTVHHYGFEIFSPAALVTPPAKKEARPQRSSHAQPVFLPEGDSFARETHTFLSLAAPILTSSTAPRLFCHLKNEAQHTKNPRTRLGLYVFGGKDGFAEALLLRTALSILEEAGVSGAHLRINSIGDRDTTGKYTRELLSTLRRTSDELPDTLRAKMEKDPFSVLFSLVTMRHALIEKLPRPVEYLSSPARAHFREVIEHLEHSGIPYELDEWLIGHRDFYAHTLFEITAPTMEGTHEKVVAGGRFDECAKRTLRATVPATAALFSFPRVLEKEKDTQKNTLLSTAKKPPCFCFIKVGYSAQVKSLLVMETLHRAKTPFVQHFGNPCLSEQLAFAETSGAPYTLIMGQREAMENAIIVRDTATRSQTTIPLCSLYNYVASLQKK